MILKVLPLVLVCLIGYGLRRLEVLQPQDAQTLAKLISFLALPAIIIRALATAEISSSLICLPLSALFVVVSLTLIALLLVHFLGWERGTAGALITAFPSFEGGAVGYTLMLLAYGETGLSHIVLFDLAQAVYLLTVVYCLSAWFGKAGVKIKGVLLQLARAPFFWAILTGLALNLLNIRNRVLFDLLDIVGNSFLLLILLLMSLEFQISRASLRLHLSMAILKTVCGLALGAAAVSFWRIEDTARAAVLVGAALPPSMLAILFSRENQLNTRFAVGFISVAIPFSLVFLTLMLNFV